MIFDITAGLPIKIKIYFVSGANTAGERVRRGEQQMKRNDLHLGLYSFLIKKNVKFKKECSPRSDLKILMAVIYLWQ